MSTIQKFRAVIEDAGGGGAFITIPFNVEQVYGKKRVKVKATLAGEPYRGSLVRMGGDCHILVVRKDIREKTGKTFGDEIEVTLEEDLEPREVILPLDIQQALQREPEVDATFRQLSYTHQNELVQWVEEAKRAQTRQDRILKMILSVQLWKEGKK